MGENMTRYSRQTILPQVGEQGQERLAASTVAIVGMGALGSINAELLTRAGVGKLILIDDDVVELSNLQRQALYSEDDVGKKKVLVAKEKLNKINSKTKIIVKENKVDKDNYEFLSDSNVILDCTDNMDSRFVLNDLAKELKKPCVFCMVVQSKGMLYVVDPDKKDRACFKDIFDQLKSIGNSDELGILNITTHFAGTLQAGEALKILLGQQYTAELVNFDVWDLELDRYRIKKKQNC